MAAATLLTPRLRIEWVSANERIGVAAEWGVLIIMWRSDGHLGDWGGAVPQPGWIVRWYDWPWREAYALTFDFAKWPRSGWASPELRYVTIPAWMLFVAAAIPTAWLWRRDRSHTPGCCQHCGYDLTGTPERCPECGWASAREIAAHRAHTE
jgi:hypothetical protein